MGATEQVTWQTVADCRHAVCNAEANEQTRDCQLLMVLALDINETAIEEKGGTWRGVVKE